MLSVRGDLPEAVCLHYTDACYRSLVPRIQEKAFHAAEMGAVLLLRYVQHMNGMWELLVERTRNG